MRRSLVFARTSHRYMQKRDGQAGLRMRIKDIASVRVRYGYRRIYMSVTENYLMETYKLPFAVIASV